jgi:PAS domain S-box-containing protein
MRRNIATMGSRLQPPALPALPSAAKPAAERPQGGASSWIAGAVARLIGTAELPDGASVGLILIALAVITAVAALIALRTRVSVAAVGWLYLLIVLPVTLRWGRALGLTTAAAAAFLLLTFMTEPRGLPYTTNGIDLISLLLSSGCIAIAVLLVHPAHADHRSVQPRLLAELVRSAADARIEADSDGTIRSWSAGAERLFGVDASGALGRWVGTLASDAQAEKLRAALRLLARGERVPALELVAVRGDGSRIDVSLAMSPILESGGVAGISLIARDITTRRRVELAFRAGDELLENAIEKLPEGLIVFDEHGQVLLANGRAGALLPPTAANPTASFGELFAQRYRLHPVLRWEDVARSEILNLLAVDRLAATRGWHLEVSRLEPQGQVRSVRYLLTLRDATQDLQEASRQLAHGQREQPEAGRVPSPQQPALNDAIEADSVSAPAIPGARQGLTHRELQVLLLLASGRSNQEIAEALNITLNTAERHVANIYRKLHVRSRTHAAAYALQHGLIPFPES